MKTVEKTQHTPGPWVPTTDGESNFSGVAVAGNWLLRIQQNGVLLIAEQEANARLIAAAPELLEALEECQGYLNCLLDSGVAKDIPHGAHAARRWCDKAIRKARGESQK